MRLPFKAALFSLVVFPALAWAGCPQFFPNGEAPQAGRLLCNNGYAVGYSAHYKVPLWSAEVMTDDSSQTAMNLHGRASFYPDARLTPSEQSGNADYHLSAYVRGHMTPSGDMPDRLTRRQTYLYSNVVPQDDALNSGPWNQIEQATRQAALDNGELYIVTGPVFPQTPDRTGPDQVAVPVAIFKVIYDAMDEKTAAILCQNETPARCRSVSVREIESLTGFDPMPGLSQGDRNSPLSVPGWAKAIRRSNRSR